MTQGPNVRRLIITRMATAMVPAGCGVGDVLRSLATAESIASHARAATAWVEQAIAAVKAAPDNTLDDDEGIAAEILRRITQHAKEASRGNPA